MNQLTATVIIPTYNYARFIGKAIHSVLEQEGLAQPPEIIVVDDGSTDDTQAVLQPFIKKGQIQYIATPNQGKAAATRTGIQQATGDIIFTLDADDYFLPHKIKTSLAIYEKFPEVVHVASPALYKWATHQNKPDHEEKIPKHFLGTSTNGIEILKYFFKNRMLFGGGSTFSAKAAIVKQIVIDNQIDMYTDEWLVMQTLLRGNSYFYGQALSVWNIHAGNFSVASLPNNTKVKANRLLQSSLFITNTLLTNKNSPNWLTKAYALKHVMRKVEQQRKQGNVNLLNHWRWVAPYIFSFRYSPAQLWKYGAIQALLH